jgi:hypothetical protein
MPVKRHECIEISSKTYKPKLREAPKPFYLIIKH